MDKDFIKKFRGIVPKKKNDKPLKVWWKEYKEEETKLEDEKFTRLFSNFDKSDKKGHN